MLPISDGGDGFGRLISRHLNAKPQTIKTVDAPHRPCTAKWWWQAKTETAIIESAEVIGLARLPPKQFHPFDLDTFGLGAVCVRMVLVAKGWKIAAARPSIVIRGLSCGATSESGYAGQAVSSPGFRRLPGAAARLA